MPVFEPQHPFKMPVVVVCAANAGTVEVKPEGSLGLAGQLV